MLSPKTLYERLGGYDAISAVANDLLARLRTDPQLGRFWAHRARQQHGPEHGRTWAGRSHLPRHREEIPC